ncbi:MAG: DUF2207 domain-containing protein, partial [Chloroflexales bacterium]|nr:DUF2207 domain-containing protein [Chloroflexales bacterium]
MKRISFFFLAAVLALLLGTAPGASAQGDGGVAVDRRDGDITIQPDGNVRVKETWVVRFSGGPFRRAFRAIPLNRVNDITDWGVSEKGAAYRQNDLGTPGSFALTTNDNDERVITWYFQPTQNAARTFELSYTLRGALRIYDGGDQFFWKFIEADRQYVIGASTVTVNLPQSFATNQLRGTTYRNSGELEEEATIQSGQQIVFNGGPFPGGDEWEVRAQWPHGAVSAVAQPWQERQDQQPFFNLISLVVASVILLGGILGLYLLWYTRGRDQPAGLVAEFYPQPPENVPPGVVGALIDERADMQDIIATIVDLARRGFLQIQEQEQQGVFGFGGGRSFTFARTEGDASTLLPYEQQLLGAIFAGGNARDLDDLRNKFYSSLPGLQSSLYDETVRAGYFARGPQQTRVRYGVLGGVALVATLACGFFGYAAVSEYAPLAFLVVVAAGIVALGLLVLSPVMPKRTPAGSTAVAKWRAFKRYLANIEKYTQVDQAKDQFDRYLPYAVAFGLEQSWVSKFSQLQNMPAPIWYQTYPYGYGYGHGQGSNNGPAIGGDGNASGGLPSLNDLSSGGLGSLSSMSTGLFSMLNATSSVFTSQPASSGSGGG